MAENPSFRRHVRLGIGMSAMGHLGTSTTTLAISGFGRESDISVSVEDVRL